MIWLIADMMVEGDKFKLLPAESFFHIPPRFLSSLMMHLNVEPDIRNGLLLMKYSVNHPNRFKHNSNTFGNDGIQIKRVAAAFMLGFFQCTTAIAVEFCVIFYL